MGQLQFKDFIITGGLTNLNDKNIELRSIQINDDLIIHTCNDYDNSLEVIKEASSGKEKKVKIMSKVYYKYPSYSNRRFRPIFKQLQEQRTRLGFTPNYWSIQICCYCPISELMSKNAKKFFKKIKYEFGIKKIFFEIYPIYKFNKHKIDLLNEIYKGELSFGLSGYQNFHNRVFLSKNLIEDTLHPIEINFIGILGKGIQNKLTTQSFDSQYINKNLLYFLSNIKTNKFIKGITNFSDIDQYRDLNYRFIKLQKFLMINSDIKFNSNEGKEIYYYHDYDHYGGVFSFKQYLLKPKLFLWKIKNSIFSFFKSISFLNNFFG